MSLDEFEQQEKGLQTFLMLELQVLLRKAKEKC